MYNEHSVCEREIEDLKKQVEYYKMLHQNEYEARQRLAEETKKYKTALEEIVKHSEWSYQGEIAQKALQGKYHPRISIKPGVSGTGLLNFTFKVKYPN